MKRKYESPSFLIEVFTANNVIAGCNEQYTDVANTKCFIGGEVEKDYVITDSCTFRAKACMGATTATHPYGTNGMVTDGSYTAPTTALGLLVFCSTMNGNTKNAAAWQFTEDSTTVTHQGLNYTDTIHTFNTGDGGPQTYKHDDNHEGGGGGYMFHCHVAPIFNENYGLS